MADLEPYTDPAFLYPRQIWRLRKVEYVHFAAMCAFICDHAESLPEEVQLVWRARWGFGKALFLVIRYSTWPLLVLATRQLLHNPLFPSMGYIPKADIWALIILRAGLLSAIGITQIIFALRLWAIWQRARWVTITLPTLFLGVWAAEIYFLVSAIHLSGPKFVGIEYLFRIPKFGLPVWALFTAFDAVIMVLTLIKAVHHLKYRSSSTTLTKVVCRDGILYFVAVAAVSAIFPVTMNFPTLGMDMQFVLATQYSLYAIMACRTVLNLRAATTNKDSPGLPTDAWTSHSLRFQAASGGGNTNEFRSRIPVDETAAWFGHGLTEEHGSTSSILVIGFESSSN
ncbi:hypothetical protein EXIGLDRAFT_838247 [Exidia glandulosa HHB12029]|uniref:DUF6533 domain-containing protein n=1 Tax=Exidia glandulosa HHB12029 TaxID=1314781 RepID=A0A165G066_EXIGL|nr:hypothetical protein EXIGLDRAFT_838247 [Exidia glandulosa HHB12029]